MTGRNEALPGMIGQHPLMREVFRLARLAASSDAPVLLVGESGTGKELVAQAIHALSRRAAKRLIPLNCATLPESLIDAELFGVEAGAFTDARRTRDGLLADADGTTLLLDELCSMPLPGQAKLLRVLQFGEYRRVGGRQWRSADTRVIATVSEVPEHLVRHQRLRADLLYRIAVLMIHLPPLRTRPADILALARAFLAAALPAGPRLRLGLSALNFLRQQHWPGNVRELESLMMRAALCLPGPVVRADDLRRLMRQVPEAASGNGATAGSPGPAPAGTLRGDRARLADLLSASGGYVATAARAACPDRPSSGGSTRWGSRAPRRGDARGKWAWGKMPMGISKMPNKCPWAFDGHFPSRTVPAQVGTAK
jgi:transcriptional regulator with PAS, ATPase and Fis domain